MMKSRATPTSSAFFLDRIHVRVVARCTRENDRAVSDVGSDLHDAFWSRRTNEDVEQRRHLRIADRVTVFFGSRFHPREQWIARALDAPDVIFDVRVDDVSNTGLHGRNTESTIIPPRIVTAPSS